MDAAVGTSLAVVFGPERFEEFLHGFHEIDEYFANTPFEKNVVVLLGMLNVWYRNFFKVASHAVLPYDQYLHRSRPTCSSSPWSPTASTSAGTAAP